jgi:hypothetical protein
MKISQLGLTLIVLSLFGCSRPTHKKDDAAIQPKYSGLVGSCALNWSNLQISVCLEYSYSTADSSDPKQSSISKLQPMCEQSSAAGKWQTDGTCSADSASWICNASAQDGNAKAILKMPISGAGATKDVAKKLCDTYKGTLTPAKVSPQST